MESFPEEGLLPRGIFSLRISGFENLGRLNRLGFRDAKGLETLEIDGCDKLRISMEDGDLFPPSLSCLRISSCSLLSEKLAEEVTECVFGVPYVEIDGEIFS